VSAAPTILLVAPRGMLGRAWCELLDAKAIPYRTAARPEFDITDPQSIARFVTPDIGVVINCSAYTNVDGAETNEQEATRINGEGAGYLAAACKAADALLVHYSTDYVFNGKASEPYKIDAPHDPCNAYGRSKAAGETAIRESGCEHLILRTSWLYAPWGKNFVLTITKYAKERPTLKVVNDQRGRPTSTQHLSTASLRLIEEGARGTLHVTDGGQCTWYDFAKIIAHRANPACQVVPCTSAEYPLPAVRPFYSVLELGPTEAIIGPMPSWEHNLGRVLDGIA